MYPKMDKLLSEFHAKGMTTFVVTNGTLPEGGCQVENAPHTAVCFNGAPNEDVYKRFIRPSTWLWKKNTNKRLA